MIYLADFKSSEGMLIPTNGFVQQQSTEASIITNCFHVKIGAIS